MKTERFILACALLLCPLAGCQERRLPTFPGITPPQAAAVLRRRAAAIHTLTARCALTLTQGGGQKVELDGLLVMAVPGRLRLRVWKFDQAIFDLTLLPDGLWIKADTSNPSRGPALPAALRTADLARFLTLFGGGFFDEPGLITDAPSAAAFHFHRDLADATTLNCDVDPDTASARTFSLRDKSGKTRFTLALSDYADCSGILWPLRLSAAALDPKNPGTIAIAFQDIQFNQELAPQALIPPPGAEKRP